MSSFPSMIAICLMTLVSLLYTTYKLITTNMITVDSMFSGVLSLVGIGYIVFFILPDFVGHKEML